MRGEPCWKMEGIYNENNADRKAYANAAFPGAGLSHRYLGMTKVVLTLRV